MTTYTVDLTNARSGKDIRVRVICTIEQARLAAIAACGYEHATWQWAGKKYGGSVHLSGGGIAAGLAALVTASGDVKIPGRKTETLKAHNYERVSDWTPAELGARALAFVTRAYREMPDTRIAVGSVCYTVRTNPHALTVLLTKVQKTPAGIWKDLV